MKAALVFFWALAAAGQTLEIHSEFQRIDPFGNFLDAGPRREILSPAVARNAWASFQLAASVREGEPSFLYIQQNPERFRVEVYRERFIKTGAGCLPDRLQRVNLPYTFMLPDAEDNIPRQNTVVFWLDVWVPAETPSERMRLQALLKSGDRWLVAPMEVRVQRAVVPAGKWKPGPAPPVTARLDAALAGPWCGAGQGTAEALTLRQMVRRNALQDRRLAKTPPSEMRAWCEGAQTPPEWYLKIRDRLLSQ